jgi:hypothetical protein
MKKIQAQERKRIMDKVEKIDTYSHYGSASGGVVKEKISEAITNQTEEEL